MSSQDLIDEYLTHLRHLGRSPRTIRGRRQILNHADRELLYGLDAASEAELRAWIAAYPNPNSRQTYYNALRSFYRWAVDHAQALDHDPTKRITRPRVPRALPRPVTDAELHTVLTRAAPRYRLAALIAAYAGLRAIELCRLDRDHITEQAITVHGKGDMPGVVPTHPRIWAAVRNLPPGPVLRNRLGGRLREGTLSSGFGEHCRDVLGLDGVTLHRMRHWAGSTVQRHVGDVRVTQEFLRHASLSSTMIYTHVSDERRRAAVLSLPTVDGAGSADDPDEVAAGR